MCLNYIIVTAGFRWHNLEALNCGYMFMVGLVVYIRTKQQCGFIPFQYLFCIIFEPQHEITNNAVCATSKGSDQPAHTRSQTRAFACRLILLKGDCTGSPESIHVKMPIFWKSHVAAYLLMFIREPWILINLQSTCSGPGITMPP